MLECLQQSCLALPWQIRHRTGRKTDTAVCDLLLIVHLYKYVDKLFNRRFNVLKIYQLWIKYLEKRRSVGYAWAQAKCISAMWFMQDPDFQTHTFSAELGDIIYTHKYT